MKSATMINNFHFLFNRKIGVFDNFKASKQGVIVRIREKGFVIKQWKYPTENNCELFLKIR